MARRGVTLDDKYSLAKERVFLSGTQAIVRLALMQKERDRRAGLNTAGYVTGYRGSPLGGLDQQCWRAREAAGAEPTSSSSPASTRTSPPPPSGAPSRSSCAARAGRWRLRHLVRQGPGRRPHAATRSATRTSPAPRRRAASSPDGRRPHLRELDRCRTSPSSPSSTAMMPILNPAGVQEILDYGLYGWALSRFAGVWVGIKCVKDTVEVDRRRRRPLDRVPASCSPTISPCRPAACNIRLARSRRCDRRSGCTLEARRRRSRSRAPTGSTASSSAAAAGRGSASSPAARAWLDVAAGARPTSASTRRVPPTSASASTRSACPGRSSREASAGSPTGSRRSSSSRRSARSIEVQIKEQIYDAPRARRASSARTTRASDWLLPASGALDAGQIALVIARRIAALRRSDDVGRALRALEQLDSRSRAADAADDRRPRPVFLLGLPAQHLDRRAGRRARLRRHRLPLHGALDGPQHRGLHPDGRRGRELDRRGAVLDTHARLPEPRRRHLLPLRHPRDPRRRRGRRQHHLQDPLQRRRRDDRRPAGRRPAHGRRRSPARSRRRA